MVDHYSSVGYPKPIGDANKLPPATTLDDVVDSTAGDGRKAVTTSEKTAVAALAELINPPLADTWLQGDPTSPSGISLKGWNERNAWYQSTVNVDPTKGVNQKVQLAAGVNAIVLGDGAADGTVYRIRAYQPKTGGTAGTVTLAATSPDVVKLAAPGVLSLCPTNGAWNDLILDYCSSGDCALAPVWTVYVMSDVGP